MTNTQTLMTFPCDFLIKIIGKNTPTLMPTIKQIIYKHFKDTLESSIISTPSKQTNYLAISATLFVHNQATLDALYLELTQHPDIKMVL